MADETAFSGPGAPDIAANPRYGGEAGNDSDTDAVETPKFFVKSNVPEDEVSLETVETPREEAARLDAVQDIGSTSSGAPKL